MCGQVGEISTSHDHIADCKLDSCECHAATSAVSVWECACMCDEVNQTCLVLGRTI